MTIIRYRAVGKDGVRGWYCLANVDWDNKRAVGTLYSPPQGRARHGSMAKHFDVKVRPNGEFRIGFGGAGLHIAFRHQRPDTTFERDVRRRAKINMDRAVRRAVAKLKKKVEEVT